MHHSVGSGRSFYRPDIDGLRAIAVLSVVLFHASFANFNGGFVGVDIFFVISGFLITRQIVERVNLGTFSFRDFYFARLRRLFPALITTVMLTFATAAVLFSPTRFADFSASAIASLTFSSNIYFWKGSGYFAAASILKPLLHTWSLTVEEQFYFVWPVLLSLALLRSQRCAQTVLLGLGALFVAVGTWFVKDPSTVFYLMQFRIFEFALGGLLSWYAVVLPGGNARREIGLAFGLGIIAYSIFSFDQTTPYPINGFVPCIGAALIILCGQARVVGFVLTNRVSISVGKASYSIYLVHWPLVVFYRYVTERSLSMIEGVALVGISMFLGYALYFGIEKRFRYQTANSFTSFHFASGCAALTCLSLIVMAEAHKSGGWTWRLGDRQSLYADLLSSDSRKYGGTGCRARPRCSTGVGRPLYVIGDSHALAYFSGLKEQFTNRKIIVFESSGCSFFSLSATRAYAENKLLFSRCQQARQAAFKEIKNESADVILAHNWYRIDLLSMKDGRVIRYNNDASYFAFVIAEIKELKRNLDIRHLMVIGDVPTTTMASSPLDCIGRPLFGRGIGCASSARSAWQLKKRSGINELLKRSAGADYTFLDPYKALCDESRCKNLADGRTIYEDNSHLSIRGSEVVARDIRAMWAASFEATPEANLAVHVIDLR